MESRVTFRDMQDELVVLREGSEAGELVVKGHMIYSPINFSVTENDEELCYVTESSTGFVEEYMIYKGRIIVATLYYKPNEYYEKFELKSRYGDYYIEGAPEYLNYSLTTSGINVLEVSKKLDIEELDIYINDDEDIGLIAAIMITINCIYIRNANRY